MGYIARIFSEYKTKDISLSENEVFVIDNRNIQDLNLSSCNLKKNHIKLKFKNNQWFFTSLTPVVHSKNEVKSSEVILSKPIIISKKHHLAVTIFWRDMLPTKLIEIENHSTISIGSSSSCDIIIQDNQISKNHLKLVCYNNVWTLADDGSTNGTYYDGKKVNKIDVKENSNIDIGTCRIVFVNSQLKIWTTCTVLSALSTKPTIFPATSLNSTYPLEFKRSPRLKKELSTDTIEIQSPPKEENLQKINWLAVVLSPLLTVLIMAFACFVIGSAYTMLLFSAPMAIVGIFMTIINYKKQKKAHAFSSENRIEKYTEYLQEKKLLIEKLHEEQRSIILSNNPSPLDCINLVKSLNRSLWQRRPSDQDFMSLRVGLGELPFNPKINVPKEQFSLKTDDLQQNAVEFATKYAKISSCPILYNAKDNPISGIIGEKELSIKLAKNLILQAATHHSYGDLKIILICERNEVANWEFFKWLPHSFDNLRTTRYIAEDRNNRAELLNYFREIALQRELDEKEKSFSNKTNLPIPFYWFIFTSPELFTSHSIRAFFNENSTFLAMSALLLSQTIQDLPKECSTILDVNAQSPVIYNKDLWSDKTAFKIDVIEEASYEIFSRTMAPIRTEVNTDGNLLPQSITFLEGFKKKSPNEFDIKEMWREAKPESTMAVPIGTSSNGTAFFFDIHETKHGPHGLVAGTTGSGKSEMVQSWILSMALHFPPSSVSFILIDFKGTGLILPFKNFPHLSGTISDIDTNINRNLIALENELAKRKILLDNAKAKNISDYLKLLKKGKVSTPLPYLFVVIDEYAEFKTQFPEFIPVINRIFATGRTLGVHIILLTQKPTAVVSDKMTANTRFRWCLKVASSSDSKEMLGCTDAARLTNPGRAFVQIGENELFEEIQSYWSGASYSYDKFNLENKDFAISSVDLQAARSSIKIDKTTGLSSEYNQIDVIVNYLDDFTRKNNIARSEKIWTQKLPQYLELSEIVQPNFNGEKWTDTAEDLTFIVGMLDNPRSQSQYPLEINLQNDGHLAIYGAPSTGKTTFLHTSMLSLLLSYTPSQLNVYCLDFGGGSLNIFKDFPHIGGIALDYEKEKCEKLIKLLEDELNSRKEKLSSYGFLNIKTYEKETGNILPYIVVVIDNFPTLLQTYTFMDNFFQKISREAASFGIYLMLSAGASNTVSYRISQNIKNVFSLQMADRSEYNMLVGRTDGLEPEPFQGRGLLRGTPPLEAQIALAKLGSENSRISFIRQLAQLMQQKWHGNTATQIPIIPEIVLSDNYRGKGTFLGLNIATISALYLPEKSHTLLISSTQTVMANSFLRIFIKNKTMSTDMTIIFDTPNGSLECFKNATTYVTKPCDFDVILEKLMPELKRRQDEQNNNARKDNSAILLVISDIIQASKELSENSLKRLKSIVTLGSGLNIFLVVSGNNDELSTLYHQRLPLIYTMVSSSATILLGGTANNHNIFHFNLDYKELSSNLSDKEAYFLIDSTTTKIRLADK